MEFALASHDPLTSTAIRLTGWDLAICSGNVAGLDPKHREHVDVQSLFSGAVFGATFDGSVFLLHILTSNLTGFSLLCSYCLHPVGTISDRAKAITLCDDCLSSRIFTGPSLASSTCTAIR